MGPNTRFDLVYTSSSVSSVSRTAAGATLDDVREAVATLEDTARIARRVLGGSHPIAAETEEALRLARSVLRARETPPPTGDLAEEVD